VLDLKTEKTRLGYVISESSKEKIETLRNRYGIKKESEDVNIVNINSMNNKEEISAENLFG